MADVLGWVCLGCTRAYPDAEGYVDFLPDVVEAPQAGIGAAAMEHPAFARVYERWWRPLYMSAARGGRADPRAELDWLLDQFWSLGSPDAQAGAGLCMDLSCGPGVVGRRLLAEGRFDRVFGLDYSAAMLRQCLDHCAREGVRDFDLVRGDAADLPLLDGSLAAVHAGNALHLWPQVLQSLREVRRVLQPGGVFVATTFVRASGWRRALSTSFARAASIRFFEPEELAAACAAAGLDRYAARIEGNSIWLRAQAPDTSP